MDKCKQPISLRNGRLFNSVLTRSGPMQRTTRMRLSQDALLDAFILLYDQCNKDILRKDSYVANFINKYRTLLIEIQSLRVNIDDFELKDLIGVGNFGEIRVVKEKSTNDVYAMKIIKKFDRTGNICSALFEEEHDIMCTATSVWLTKLQYSFQDNKNLYFVMDYHSGGNLSSLMKNHNGVLTPEMARFYLAETALAIRALHQMDYVHRDIKPDNILLDCCGHIKLTDFGSAAKLSSSGLVTHAMPVKSPEYIAPEILYSLYHKSEDKAGKQYYGVECDYWSLGILAYELVVGRTPFSRCQMKNLYFNLMNYKKNFKYPDSKMIPESLQDLISKLLEDQSVRLKHDGIVKHSFFDKTNWSNIRNEVPPFVPSSSSPDDVSNFIVNVQNESARGLNSTDNCKGFSGKNLPFIGFTFSHVPDACDKSKKSNDSGDREGEKRNHMLETLLSVTSRENKNLVSKLFEVEFGRSEEIDNLEKNFEEKKRLLEICETERNKLQREFAKVQAENANLRKTLELERQDRKEMESNALKLISENKNKIERNFNHQIRQLNAKIEEINDELTESHTLNNELTCTLDRMKAEFAAATAEIERLKNVEIEFKNKMAEAREIKRQSIVDLESRLEKMANENQLQVNALQKKLNEETAAKLNLEEKFKLTDGMWRSIESGLKYDVKCMEKRLANYASKIMPQQAEINSLKCQLKENPRVNFLEEKLEEERKECARLKSKLENMEQELKNSNLNHESVISTHEESMKALENELREASEEKIRLKKKLQNTKEVEEENKQKLSNLEVVVDRLEQGVIKLEAENAKLKQQVIAHSQPITSETEARYQEKISMLEDQTAKLENQLQKLREVAVLEKESSRSTQIALLKVEKELSNAKIDIRIAKREGKTAEDSVNRLQEELKKWKDKLSDSEENGRKNLSVEREKLDKLNREMVRIETALSQKEAEVESMKNQLKEVEELKREEERLKRDRDEALEKCSRLEKEAEELRGEKDKAKEDCLTLEAEKLKMANAMEELKRRISGLELNNTVLKETGAMLDEQLEDYEKFTTSQEQKIERLTREKISLEKEIDKIQNELRTCRQNLNEEKSLKVRAEQRVGILENEISNKDDSISKLQKDLSRSSELLEKKNSELLECEEKMASYEMEIREGKQMYNALEGECQWLKKEVSTHLGNLYSLRESNYKLTQDFSEEHQIVVALQERICELQDVITELETFHKQREVKDEATKQQQNKLINFLREKLDDTKKKKTLSNVLFGSRNKENVASSVSPVSSKSGMNNQLRSKASSRNLMDSPATKEALSQIVKSPTSQSYFQRQASLQRMHHNIPHRFKTQSKIRVGTCDVCHSQINRSNQCSMCTQCKFVAHPKCAIIAPKTCGLPQGLVRHYARSVLKTNENPELDGTVEESRATGNGIEGWIKVFNSSKTTWEKKYARLEGSKVLIFEKNPSDGVVTTPTIAINVASDGGKVIVGENPSPDEIPTTPKTEIPLTIKMAIIPETTCWPEQIYFLMAPTPSDKTKWLTALNRAVADSLSLSSRKYQGTIIHDFAGESILNLNCVVQISEKLALLGAEEGLFSLRLSADGAKPVKIEGVSKVRQVSIVPQLGIGVMIAGERGKLVSCDRRALTSNAEAAACANPRITVDPIGGEESYHLFEISPVVDGIVYMTAATSSRLCILRWCAENGEFETAKIMETLHPCNCILYTKSSVVVGCDKFFVIELRDFSVREFLDPSIKSLAFWRIGSFPMKIFQISKNEFLLCFNEFGVFVDETGKKTQCDLKWNKVPCDFAFAKPYLFIVHMSSVEVIRVPFLDSKSADDSICTTSTATITDSVHVGFNGPRYLGLGNESGSIFVRVDSSPADFSGVNLVMLEGRKIRGDDLGSCTSLETTSEILSRNNKNDGDEFSFTSSIVQSLENLGSSTPRHSDDDSCNTYTVSERENQPNNKCVTFVQKTIL